jgi:hypothetical protein
MTSLRVRIRRRSCHRWGHQWGDWRPNTTLLPQVRRCLHCTHFETRDQLHAAFIEVGRSAQRVAEGIAAALHKLPPTPTGRDR